jgi:hypothetical protein
MRRAWSFRPSMRVRLWTVLRWRPSSDDVPFAAGPKIWSKGLPCCRQGLLATDAQKGFVARLEHFIRMDLLSPESVENWRRGRIAYLERVIRCNLGKASRILRILRMHARSGSQTLATVYKRWTKGSCPLLRSSKTGDHNIENAYALHFVSPGKGSLGTGVKDVLVDSMGTHMTGDQHATRD